MTFAMTESNGTASARTIAIADDHPIVRSALVGALGALGPGLRFVEAHDAASTLAVVDDHPELDLLLMDLAMPGMNGIDAIRTIRARAPQLPVAIVSAEEDAPTVAALLALGVCGYVPKSDPPGVIVSAVRLILDGGVYVPPRLLQPTALAPASPGARASDRLGLTPRQLEVIRLLARGEPNKVIARHLAVSEGTVKVHLLAIFRALNVRNRTAAVLAAQQYLD